MLFPDFLGLLAFAKKLWYTIYVGTNGTMLADPDFASVAIWYIDELSLSVHWDSQETCTEQTGDRGHFDRFPKIIQNINQYKGQHNILFTNIVLNQKNYTQALKIIQFLHAKGYQMDQVLISVVAPEGIADHHFWGLVFDLSIFAWYIPDIVTYCDHHGVKLRFFGLPTCILWERYIDYANDIHWEERHTIERFATQDGKVKLVDIYSPDNSRKRTFVERCHGCIWREKPCTGVFTKYLYYYSF